MSTFHPSSQRADFATCAARWGWVSTRAQMLPQSCYLGVTWRRAQGKSYYTAGGGTRFWLTEEEQAERRAEGKTMEPIDIDYKEGEAQDCWHPPLKKASIADIEAMLATGKPIVLYNC